MGVSDWRVRPVVVWDMDIQMKKKSTFLKEQKKQLRHWQMIYRMELTGLQRTKEKIKEIAREMRRIQNENDNSTNRQQ